VNPGAREGLAVLTAYIRSCTKQNKKQEKDVKREIELFVDILNINIYEFCTLP
jgi:hypothetical protein